MYHGLWGGLLSQAAAPAPPAGSAGVSGVLHGALAELQTRLLARLAGGTDSSGATGTDASSGASSALSKLDGYLAEKLDATLTLLGRSGSAGGGGSSTHALQEGLLPTPGGANWSTTEALELAAQAWALGALAGGSGAAVSGLALHAAASSLGGGSGGGSSSSGLVLEGQPLVASPSWEAFRPLLCLRLQNFGNADGWSSVLLGPAPCSKSSSSISSDAFRWRSSAAFLLDCSRRGGGSPASAASGATAVGAAAGSSSAAATSVAAALAEAGLAAAERMAASLAAAVSSRRTCRLAVGSTSASADAPATGSALHLEHSFEQPLFAAPRMDALRLRVCNM